ncbi:MAG TPA: tetratricopeptide repeat protein [Planctomycetota bacterium]
MRGFPGMRAGAVLLAGILAAWVTGSCGGSDSAPDLDEPGSAALVWPADDAPPGVADCRECHASVVANWLDNAMAHTLGPLPAELPGGPAANWSVHPVSGFGYRVERDAAGARIVEARPAPVGSPQLPAHRREQRLVARIGAGVHVVSLVAEENGRWTFAPLEWFPAAGFVPAPHQQFATGGPPPGLVRPITGECLGCHTSEAVPATWPLNAFGEWRPRGIGCEACHGPGATHVARMQEALAAGVNSGWPEDNGIANPANFPVARQLDVCARCHLQGDARLELLPDGAPPYRPGDDLFARRAVFVDATPGEDFGFVSQVERLALSACFQESPQMSCTTCHDPHVPARLQPRERMLAKCAGCHAQPHRAVPVATKGRDCVQCHMRRSQPFDLGHVAIHDHFVRVRPAPPAEAPLRALQSTDAGLVRFAYRAQDPPRLDAQQTAQLQAVAHGHLGHLSEAAAGFAQLAPPGRAAGTAAAPGAPQALPMLHFVRGRVLTALGRKDQAEAAYRDALRLDADLVDARLNLGWLLLEKAERARTADLSTQAALEEVRALAEATARAHPLAAVPWNQIAFAARFQDRPAEAAAALDESLRRDPAQADVWRARAQTHGEAGERSAARRALLEAFRLAPDLPGLADELARAGG